MKIEEFRFCVFRKKGGFINYGFQYQQKVNISFINKLTDKQKIRLSEKAKTKGYSFSAPVYDESGEIDNEASRRVTIKFFINMEAAGNVAE